VEGDGRSVRETSRILGTDSNVGANFGQQVRTKRPNVWSQVLEERDPRIEGNLPNVNHDIKYARRVVLFSD